MKTAAKKTTTSLARPKSYDSVLSSMVELLQVARRASARTVNVIMTATYWEMGRRIIEFEQGGSQRAVYSEQLLERLAIDLTRRFGRGFGFAQLHHLRQFYFAYPQILQSPVVESRPQAKSTTIRRSLIGELDRGQQWHSVIRALSLPSALSL